MRIASVLTPLSDHHLRLAAQLGVTDITYRYPGPGLVKLLATKERIESFGLKQAVIEGCLPMEQIKYANDLDKRAAEIGEMKALVRNMGKAGIGILCTNFMAGTDWVRTSTVVKDRGGALVTGFNLREVEKAVSLSEMTPEIAEESISADKLWDNLEFFLKELVPICEEAGVAMAMHPDDPPLEEFMGKARIMNSVENIERLVSLVPSPANGLCFCQGTFAEMGVDIPETICRLGKHIRYVHFRDIRGAKDDFVETFHDNGPTDMFAAIRAYRDIGYDGPMRPDHVPQLDGEEDGEPGYTMLGRLYAYGYMRGLIEAAGNA